MSEYGEKEAKKGLNEPLPVIESFPNQFKGEEKRYRIHIEIPEYTSVCPKTGLPDFGEISIDYVPKDKCVELKSLKEYILAYRNLGIFYENAVNRIFEDFMNYIEPYALVIEGFFNPRGGIYTTVRREFGKL